MGEGGVLVGGGGVRREVVGGGVLKEVVDRGGEVVSGGGVSEEVVGGGVLAEGVAGGGDTVERPPIEQGSSSSLPEPLLLISSSVSL